MAAFTYDTTKSVIRNLIDAVATVSGTFSNNLTLENGEVIKNDSDGRVDIVGNVAVIGGTTGGLATVIAVEATVDITAAASATLAVAVPIGARLLGAQVRVDAALADGETWDAEWNDGASLQAIASGAAVAQNTKVNALHDDNANTPICDAETNIVVTKNGGGDFTAQGTLRAIAYYSAAIAMDDVS